MSDVKFDDLTESQKLDVIGYALRTTGGIDLDEVATTMQATLGIPGSQAIPDAAHPILQSQDHPATETPEDAVVEAAPEVDQAALDAERAAMTDAAADQGQSASEVAAGAVPNTPLPEEEHPIIQNAAADEAAGKGGGVEETPAEEAPAVEAADVHPAAETAAAAVESGEGEAVAAALVEVDAALAEWPSDTHLLAAKADLESALQPAEEEPPVV